MFGSGASGGGGGGETSAALPVAWEEVVAIFVLSMGDPATTATTNSNQLGSASKNSQDGNRPRSPGPLSMGSKNGGKSPKSERSGKSNQTSLPPPRVPYAESWMSRLKCELLLLEGQMLSHTGRLADAEKRLTRLHRELSHTGRAESITACSAYTTIAEM